MHGVRLERAGRAGFTLGVTAVELSSLIAAVRIAADVLEADERTPPEAVMRLIKAYDDGRMIDLIFRLSGHLDMQAVLGRAEEINVAAVPMPPSR
jgi:hypothetical protein